LFDLQAARPGRDSVREGRLRFLLHAASRAENGMDRMDEI
jgi:hypothetical protein